MKTVHQSMSVLLSAAMFAASMFMSSCGNSGKKNASETATTTTTSMSDSVPMKMKADSIAAAHKRKGSASLKEQSSDGMMKMTKDKYGIYNRADVMPQYPGGESALDNYIQTSIQYPQQALNNDKEGTVFVKFAVDENGKVINATVLGHPLGYGLDEEALRVVNDMPNWTPGKIKGKPVKVYYTLPIAYALSTPMNPAG
jgi:periplasmic protein TonB